MEQLGLTFESEVLFSDYCKDTIFVGHPERIKFTKDLLLFCDSDNYYGHDYESDDWLKRHGCQAYTVDNKATCISEV